MDRTFGSVADTAPEGFLPRRVHFVTLVELDTPTKEGFLTREIASAGFGTRELPLTITGVAPGRGHEGAVPVGRLDQVKIAGRTVEGWGWLLDDAGGRQAFKELATKTVWRNSIEMTDVRLKVKFTFPEDPEDDMEIKALFTEANIGATTLVMKPAFANATVELDDELTAALMIEADLEVTAPFEIVESATSELTAAGGIILPHDAFTVPEPDHYQTFHVHADGRTVSGHLGRFGEPHTGLLKRTFIPYSQTGYASYCKHPFPTDKGRVFTGPIILLGGHEKTAEQINRAMANVENAWADIVVVDGKIGPWVCGVVRPGVTQEALHSAMGSGISGHWIARELYAVCSVNADGFDVPRATDYVVEMYEEEGQEVLVASFAVPGQEVHEPETEVSYDEAIAAARAALEDDNGSDQHPQDDDQD